MSATKKKPPSIGDGAPTAEKIAAAILRAIPDSKLRLRVLAELVDYIQWDSVSDKDEALLESVYWALAEMSRKDVEWHSYE